MRTDVVQEEDFVTNLYHRNLLTKANQSDILQELEDAIIYLGQEKHSVAQRFLNALIPRLELRVELLSAVQTHDVFDGRPIVFWDRCLKLLPDVKDTTQFGKPVDSSFSKKIQRRLASSVPPRPIITTTFDEAYNYMMHLCQHSKDAYRILDHHGGPHLLVCVFEFVLGAPLTNNFDRRSCGLSSLGPHNLRYMYDHCSRASYFMR